MFGSDMGSLRLEAFGSAGWTQLWSRTGQQGLQWHLAVVRLPPHVAAVRFIGATIEGGLWSDMALDAIATGLTTVEFHQLTCDFRFCDFRLHSGLWQSTAALSWQQNGSQESTWILETAAIFNTTEGKLLVFDYQLNGSDTVALEVQHQTSAGVWQQLLLESGSRGAGWHTAIVSIPASTVSLRLLANVTSEADLVKLDSLSELCRM